MRNLFRLSILAIALVATASLSTMAFAQMGEVTGRPAPEKFIKGGQKQLVDACPNIEGVQESVPEGMTLKDGKCVQEPVPPPPPEPLLTLRQKVAISLLAIAVLLAIFFWARLRRRSGHEQRLQAVFALLAIAGSANAATVSKLEPYKVEVASTKDVTIRGSGFGTDIAKVEVAFSADTTKGHPEIGIVIKAVSPTEIQISVSVPAGALDSFRKFWLKVDGKDVRNALTLWVVQPAVSSSLDAGDRRFARREAVAAALTYLTTTVDGAVKATAKETQAVNERAVQARQRADSAVAVGEKLVALHDALDQRIAGHERRITALEGRDLSPLEARIGDLEKEVARLREELGSVKFNGDKTRELASVTGQAVLNSKGGKFLFGGGGPRKEDKAAIRSALPQQ